MSKAHTRIEPLAAIASIDPRIFGGFVEHLGRHIYDGIYEPTHPQANTDGFRMDVIALVRELGVSTIRYPGGNFLSGYRWEDGVGPVESRPRRLDVAWHSVETNEVGLHEFSSWLDHVGSELMLAVNLGTRGTEAALDLIEYANVPVETTITRQRAANGHPAPFNVRMWCLGNEMDGPWQLGHRSADDYGKLASRTAKALRQVDKDIELVVCGSSSRAMPTFGTWERTVLEHTFDDVDFISCHAYYFEKDGDSETFLTSAIDLDRFIADTIAACDLVAAERKSDKRINLSVDEWNIWYQGRDYVEPAIDEWPVAPRLLEDTYTVQDAVVLGDLLITLLQHSDRVRSASLAQLVNVIAPIMTEPGGPVWRQTTFYPFSITSRLGRGTALRLPISAGPVHSNRFGDVSAVNGVATVNEDGASVFLVNRSLTESAEIEIDVRALDLDAEQQVTLSESYVLWDKDRYAVNTLEQPDRVTPRDAEATIEGGRITIRLQPVSWTALRLS